MLLQQYYIMNVTSISQKQKLKQTQIKGKHIFILGAEEN